MSSLLKANSDGQADRRAGGRTGTSKYRDACASKNKGKIKEIFNISKFFFNCPCSSKPCVSPIKIFPGQYKSYQKIPNKL
jgi:hypothetical protein